MHKDLTQERLQKAVDDCLSGLKELRITEGVYLASPSENPYPHIYSRDLAFICKALDRASLHDEAKAGLRFLCRVQERDGCWHQRYSPGGEAFCNRPGQIDCTGILLHVLCNHIQATQDGAFTQEVWPTIQSGVNCIFGRISDGLICCDHSVHEAPVEEGHEIWANAWCWRGLMDASRFAEMLGESEKAAEWIEAAASLKGEITSRFWDDELGYFRKVLASRDGAEAIDISGMAALWTGLVSPKDTIGARQLDATMRELWNAHIGGFLRYRRFGLIKEWHWYDGGNGSWLFYTAFMASTYLQAGEIGNAEKCLRWCLDQFLPDGLLPEHVSSGDEFDLWNANDPDVDRLFSHTAAEAESRARIVESDGQNHRVVPWIFPLAWSHAQVLAAVLDYAEHLGINLRTA